MSIIGTLAACRCSRMCFRTLRFTFRTLARDTRFTTFALLIIAVGVGATLTVFSVINALLLRPLPFHDPAHLVWIGSGTRPGLSAQTVQVSHLIEFRQATRAFEDVAAYFAFYGAGDDRLTGRSEPERLTNVPGIPELLHGAGGPAGSGQAIHGGGVQMELVPRLFCSAMPYGRGGSHPTITLSGKPLS